MYNQDKTGQENYHTNNTNNNNNTNNTNNKNNNNKKNNKNIKNKIIYLYGRPNETCVRKAQNLISKKKSNKQTRNVSPKETKKIFQEFIKEYNIKDWEIHINKKSVANASVNPGEKQIIIKSRNFSFKEINTLICHEIETHVFRSANGYLQKYEILGSIGTPDYLKTEEGIATVMEELNGNFNPTRFRFFCAREIASFLAQTKSFHEIFKILHQQYNLSLNNSYLITKRVKRGLDDTSRPGGFIKDHVYFEGREMIMNYIKNGRPLNVLFAGKFGIRDLPLLKKELKKPVYLPRVLQNPLLQTILYNKEENKRRK
jgi:hypothetical protein